MENEGKVFSSSIIRTHTNPKNDLYDILQTEPANPIVDNDLQISSECSFTPKNDKYYISRKKSGSKVKTVREIRAIFESDVYSYLLGDLEKQKNLLMRKIRHGSSRHGKTKDIAKNMLTSSNPVSKWAWQMLMNINPEGHKFPSQYVLYNGRHIQVNGSKGGCSKFLLRCDIGKNKKISLNKLITKKHNITRKISLLQNSLNVKFKPGPLTKKKNLDTSYQKHNFGEMELVTLPKPGLDISPAYDKPIAPCINSFIQSAFVYKSDGLISEKWADFAMSMLGTNKNGTAMQLKENCNVTFDLDYKCFQNRVLMRKDSDIANQEIIKNTSVHPQEQDDSVIISEVSNIIKELIDSVEISLLQNELYFGDDEIRQENVVENISSNSQLREKGKRKYGELGRLDVTVIRIPDTSESLSNNFCRNTYCSLGCICDSLNSSYNFKTHCGRIDCMFQCKCDFSKYKLSDALANDSAEIIRGLVNIEKKLGQTLAKEEHKFHQTVVVTDEKSILLNSRKRNWKTSKKYADFFSSMQLKAECDIKKNLSIVCTDLKIKNVEPWCMVHSLYKCFCKGKFTRTSLGLDENVTNTNKITVTSNKTYENKKVIDDANTKSQEAFIQEQNNEKHIISDGNEPFLDYDSSARTIPYEGRKYNDQYYKSTNTKIFEMEQNDKSLRKKLSTRTGTDECHFENIDTPDISSSSSSLDELLANAENLISDNDPEIKTPSSKNLVQWLETNYKKYKVQTNNGLKKPSLLPPRHGSMALYPWDFILSRYREKKNHFLISKQIPYRIFMAVDTKHSFFRNYININDIALSDLNKYPVTVKNLLTNATDLKDNFCILCGLSHCWELVGSVTKVNNDKSTIKPIIDVDKTNSLNEKSLVENSSDVELNSASTESVDKLNNEIENITTMGLENSTEHSRWFVMTIENDFTEIQFYNKGFFVKYDSIVKAINVAKVSGKTVKLSSQNCSNRQNNPSFGIYAVPSDKDNYVFIGPYEKDESLGIETIKSAYDPKRTNPTRGTWITTNKIDNLKVIDNPLLYLPSTQNSDKSLLLPLAPHTNDKEGNDNDVNIDISPQKDNKTIATKPIKPITIRKTNFYQLGSSGFFRPVVGNKKGFKSSQSILLNKSIIVHKDPASAMKPLLNFPSILSQDSGIDKQTDKKVLWQSQKPVAEIAPQVKQTNIISSSGAVQRKQEGSMFVLKPEEINKRSFQKQIIHKEPQASNCNKTDDMNMDIENFLNSFVICEQPKDECFVISDEEDISEDPYRNVWIVCKNIDNIGWIAGRRNKENHLSFEFPGFKFSDFYKEDVAYEKISQVMSRKIYVPRHINLEWEALDSLPENKVHNKLTVNDLPADYVLTKKGLRHKSEMINKLKSANSTPSSDESTSGSESSSKDLLIEKNILLKDLEDTSKTLEEESLFLLEKMTKKGEILESFSKTSEDLRKELTEQLTNIKTDSDELE